MQSISYLLTSHQKLSVWMMVTHLSKSKCKTPDECEKEDFSLKHNDFNLKNVQLENSQNLKYRWKLVSDVIRRIFEDVFAKTSEKFSRPRKSKTRNMVYFSSWRERKIRHNSHTSVCADVFLILLVDLIWCAWWHNQRIFYKCNLIKIIYCIYIIVNPVIRFLPYSDDVRKP